MCGQVFDKCGMKNSLPILLLLSLLVFPSVRASFFSFLWRGSLKKNSAATCSGATCPNNAGSTNGGSTGGGSRGGGAEEEANQKQQVLKRNAWLVTNFGRGR